MNSLFIHRKGQAWQLHRVPDDLAAALRSSLSLRNLDRVEVHEVWAPLEFGKKPSKLLRCTDCRAPTGPGVDSIEPEWLAWAPAAAIVALDLESQQQPSTVKDAARRTGRNQAFVRRVYRKLCGVGAAEREGLLVRMIGSVGK